jgi:hypothetical protein
MHVGWRQRPDGSVRVGVWSATAGLDGAPGPMTTRVEPKTWARCKAAGGGPVAPTRTVTEPFVVAHDGGRWGEVVLPASWLDTAGRPPAVRSRRDLDLAPVADKVASWLDGHPQPGQDGRPGLTGADVRRWRSPARFAGLARRWHHQPPTDGAEVAALLWEWAGRDRHLWQYEASEREQLALRRDEAWRLVGAWLAGAAGVVRVDDSDLATLRRRPDVAEDDPALPGVAAARARARAQLSAPGGLRAAVVAAAERRGVPVVRVSAAFLTRTCPACGVVGAPDPRYAAAAVVQCPSCGVEYDQDRSAVGLMLRERSGGEPGKRKRSRAG